MSLIHDLKSRWADVPGISNLTIRTIAERDTYSFGGKIVAVDPRASIDEIDIAIRAAASSPAIAQMPAGQPIEEPATEEAVEPTPVPTASLLPSLTIQSPKEKPMSITGIKAGDVKGILQGVKDRQAAALAKVGELDTKSKQVAEAMGNVTDSGIKELDTALAELGQFSNLGPTLTDG